MAVKLLACLLLFGAATAIPKTDHSKHYEGEVHNAQYDHEAFLGEDQAKTFDQLTPEESTRRLGIIYDKIDKNEDGFVDLSELKTWITYSQKRYIHDDVDRQWRLHNPDGNETIEWPTYKDRVYGFMADVDVKEFENDGAYASYSKMLNRDRRRWAIADRDQDDKLTKEEFTNFLHPEDCPYMRDIVAVETIEDIDKDGDGKVSVTEYIGDMYTKGDGEDDEDEPDWVKNERDIFNKFRDKDKDGVMDAEEVKDWIVPSDFDHAEAEARHLIYEADTDNDEKLTKTEVLDKYDLFVGSQATDFGEVLVRHDEF